MGEGDTLQVQKGYPHRACRIAVDAVAVGAKRSIHTVDTVIWVVGTTAFRAKRSIHAVGHAADAVDTVGHSGSSRCWFKKGQLMQWTQQIWVVGENYF